MNTKMLKWFIILMFAISALTGCYIHRDRDYYYRDRDYGYHHDRDDWHHSDRDDWHDRR